MLGICTLILHHCCLNSTTNKMSSMLPSFSFTPNCSFLLSSYHILIPPQLLPSPKNWPFCLHILHIFLSSPLLILLENTFFTIPLYMPCNLPIPSFPNPPSQLLATLQTQFQCPFLIKCSPNWVSQVLYSNSSWSLLCLRSHFQTILLLLLLLFAYVFLKLVNSWKSGIMFLKMSGMPQFNFLSLDYSTWKALNIYLDNAQIHNSY